MDRLTAKDIIGSTIIVTVCALSVYAFYAHYFREKEKRPSFLPRKYQKYKMIKKIHVSHNTRKYRFALRNTTDELGLPCGRYISFRFFETNPQTNEKEEIRRPYTPITSNKERGHFDVMIKVYSDGKMSSYLDTLRPNRDYIEARGPLGDIEYISPGLVIHKKKERHTATKVGMICGGTGITPMLQLMTEIIGNHDPVQVSLIFGNVSIDDILLKPELEAIRQKHDNIHIRFIIDKAPTDGREWNEDVGYVTSDIIKSRIFPPAKDVVVFLCGPPVMTKICKANLLKLG
eukprot:159921_1